MFIGILETDAIHIHRSQGAFNGLVDFRGLRRKEFYREVAGGIAFASFRFKYVYPLLVFFKRQYKPFPKCARTLPHVASMEVNKCV